jgi:hypothetical protein
MRVIVAGAVLWADRTNVIVVRVFPPWSRTMPFEFPLPVDFDYSTLSSTQLDELEAAAREAAQPITVVNAADLTDEQVTLLESLGAAVQSVATARTALAEREAAEAAALAERSERIGALASILAPAPAPAATPPPVEPVRVGQVAANSAPPARQVQTPTLLRTFAEQVVSPDSDREFESWSDVARFAERRLSAYSGMTGSHRNSLVSLRRNFSDDLVQRDDTVDALVAHAVDPSRLPGGALTAAAGWCAPSQTIYDLCELETTDGLVDIPEIQVTRGGIRFTPGPDFATIFGGAGYFHQTEAQVIANTTKPCMDIPCPTFTDIRLEVEGVCVTGSILQRRGYPELVERFLRGAMVAHVHKVNAFVIAQMVAGSTVVDLEPPVDVPLDVSATSHTLMAVEQQAMDLRYRNRLAQNAQLEAVFPFFAKALFRADISRRQGLAEFMVTDAMIDDWLNLRGVRPQWVYDWQDAFSGVAAGPGAATPLTLWPNSFFFLIYPAGTWLRGSDDTIRLETIYDSTNLATNRYTALFTEEGVLVAQVCNGGSRVVEVRACPSGVTAAPVAYVCA